MASPATDILDGERHHEALEALAIQSLAEGDFKAAIRYADRRCRVLPLAKASHYILRGDVLYRLGFTDAAVGDIETALTLAPDDLAANRRMMMWGDPDARLQSARRVLAREHDFSGLREAIEIVGQTGQKLFFALDHIGTSITGWVAWRGTAPLTLRDSKRKLLAKIENDPGHPLVRADMHAANISIEIPPSIEGTNPGKTIVSLWCGKRSVLDLPINHRGMPALRKLDELKDLEPRKTHEQEDVQKSHRATRVTLIIPVYDDFSATRKCLKSALAEIAFDESVSVLIVDDVTPDKKIRALLEKIARRPNVEVLTNALNLGFVGSVNRALAAVKDGDVILLNSDTIAPKGFVEKLSQAAYSASDIGTVTPLSNNGEFTSFPVPFEANPLPSVEDIGLLDEIAAKANAGVVVDIPNGIGFCLYITRRCLDAVGLLSDHYHRGYLEDVDFCLRAGNIGFRNVAAASVFVGHQGSASFGSEKRSLVVFNMERLEARFPSYRTECAAFLKMDPLALRRSAMERLLRPNHLGATLLVTGGGVMEAVARSRAEYLMVEGTPSLLAISRYRAAGPVVSLSDTARGIPQSLSFELAIDEEVRALEAYLAWASLARVEIADPAATSPTLLEILLRAGLQIDLLIGDDGLITDGADRHNGKTAALNDWRHRWQTVAVEAKTIFVPTSRSRHFTEALLAQLTPSSSPDLLSKMASVESSELSIQTTESPISGKALGIIVVGGSVRDYELVLHVSRLFRRQLPDISIIVIGRTIDDLALMKLGNVFVTGRMTALDFDQVMDWYGVSALFLGHRTPLFGHLLVEKALQQRRVPLAAMDWLFDSERESDNHFGVNPQLSATAIASELIDWFNQF